MTFFSKQPVHYSWSLLDFEHMLLIQKENSTTQAEHVKMFDFTITKKQT